MNNCSSTIERQTVPLDRSRLLYLQILPQWHIFMCRARWLVTPQPSDAGSFVVEHKSERWLGSVKTLLWMVVSIGAGLLIAGLSG